MALDVSRDFEVWDNRETVRLASFRRPDMAAADEDQIPDCKRRALTRKELLASNGAYTGADLVWLIPQARMLAGFVIKPHDVVTDDEDTPWTVLEVAHNKWRQTWRLICRNLAIAFDLRDEITIEKATPAADDARAWARTWKPLYTNLLCRVQPQQAEVVAERGVQGQQTSFLILLSRQLSLLDARESRVLFKGQILDIDRYTNAEQIGELPRLEARLKV